MKLALIPPYQLIGQSFKTDYQLFLPECLRDPAYAARYHKRTTEVCGEEYIILDNGAAEGERWDPRALMAAAAEWRPDEIVIPDEMKDAQLTIDLAKVFLDEWYDYHYDFMFVAQGKSIDEVLWCVEQVDDDERIRTIGIPRHIPQTVGHRDARMEVMGELLNRYDDKYQYHFLGATPLWPQELQFAAVAYGDKLRGMDTSMPFVYAILGEKLDGGLLLKRPPKYFDTPIDDIDMELVEYNVDMMLRWSHGEP